MFTALGLQLEVQVHLVVGFSCGRLWKMTAGSLWHIMKLSFYRVYEFMAMLISHSKAHKK